MLVLAELSLTPVHNTLHRMMTRLLVSPEVTRKPTCVEELYLIQQAYDTVLLYAHALNVTQDPTNGKELTRTVKEMESILGKSGKIIPNLQVYTHHSSQTYQI